ncbi:MAG TPA: TetR/AcrR family transcriptional regulator [Tepidisphaeraceae bacterium]|jgi:AcrR family transcriptional regulator|nr:TetR/AcrR family transcriptional regulator [Tepidisphaeraceae bacterium]
MTLVAKKQPGRPCDKALQERRREAILKVAGGLFARHGFTATDVQWVADALRISKGTVYRYFPSKEKLFLAAVARGICRMQEHIESAKSGVADKVEEIRAAVIAYLRFFKKNPELVELFIQERAQFKGKHRPIYFQYRDARRGPFREHLAGLLADGRIRDMPLERVIDVLGDVLYGTMFTNHFAGRDKPFEAQAQDILDVVFNGILSEKERAAV